MADTPNNIIYGLIDPRTRLVRYVGQSCRGLDRVRRHRWKSSKDGTHCARWIRSLRRDGLEFDATVLERVEGSEDLNTAERYWIAYGRASGWPLTNLTSGGDGGLAGYVFSAESRARIGDAHRGMTHTPEARAKMSRAHAGKVLSAEHRAKCGRHSRGKVRPSDVVQRISNAKRGMTFTDEHRQALSEAAKRRAARARNVDGTYAHG
jgi:hypothetical protein